MVGLRCLRIEGTYGVDWFLPTGHTAADQVRLRHEFRRFLDRHAAAGQDLAGAELVFGELCANVFKHTDSALWVDVLWALDRLHIAVHDLGPGFALDPQPPSDPYLGGGRGLYLSGRLSTELRARTKHGTGTVVSAALPLAQALEPLAGSPAEEPIMLPSVKAPGADRFDRESFLVALVAGLAKTVEFVDGPDRARELVATIGRSAAAEMETEFREATGIAGPLTPDELGRCLVRLKAAIDGGFHVAEVNDDRIVLVNDRCPFGPTVQQAPSLCQMTASVFGGIATQSFPTARLTLDERIAIGDARCRVTIDLNAEHASAPGT